MKFNLTESEVKNILEMHSKVKTTNKILKEDDKQNTKEQLQSFIDSGCIKNGFVVSMSSTNPNKQFAVKQESTKTPGKYRYFFIDNTYGTVDSYGKFKLGSEKWECNNGKIETNKVSDAKTKADSEEVKKSTDANIELTKKEGEFKTKEELIKVDTEQNIENPVMYEKKVVNGVTLYRRKISSGIGEALTTDQQAIVDKWESKGAKLRKELDGEQAKTWAARVVSPASEGYFSQDLIMYFDPAVTVKDATITTTIQTAVTNRIPTDQKDCKTTIEAYYLAFKKKRPLEPNEFEALKAKTQACKNEYGGDWGALSGGGRMDNYLEIMSGGIGGPSRRGEDAKFRLN